MRNTGHTKMSLSYALQGQKTNKTKKFCDNYANNNLVMFD